MIYRVAGPNALSIDILDFDATQTRDFIQHHCHCCRFYHYTGFRKLQTPEKEVRVSPGVPWNLITPPVSPGVNRSLDSIDGEDVAPTKDERHLLGQLMILIIRSPSRPPENPGVSAELGKLGIGRRKRLPKYVGSFAVPFLLNARSWLWPGIIWVIVGHVTIFARNDLNVDCILHKTHSATLLTCTERVSARIAKAESSNKV